MTELLLGINIRKAHIHIKLSHGQKTKLGKNNSVENSVWSKLLAEVEEV